MFDARYVDPAICVSRVRERRRTATTGFNTARRAVATTSERGGIWRFLTVERAADAESFARQYRSIREREGYRASSAEYYRRLPEVAADNPHAAEWRVRRRATSTC